MATEVENQLLFASRDQHPQILVIFLAIPQSDVILRLSADRHECHTLPYGSAGIANMPIPSNMLSPSSSSFQASSYDTTKHSWLNVL